MKEKEFNYVAGFCFDYELQKVLLIQKMRPTWQIGKLNGIGGKIEPNETPLNAMAREFSEKTGLPKLAWNAFCILEGVQWRVHFFYAISDCLYNAAKVTDETPVICQVRHIHAEQILINSGFVETEVIPNLKWLIPMAINSAKAADSMLNCHVYENFNE